MKKSSPALQHSFNQLIPSWSTPIYQLIPRYTGGWIGMWDELTAHRLTDQEMVKIVRCIRYDEHWLVAELEAPKPQTATIIGRNLTIWAVVGIESHSPSSSRPLGCPEPPERYRPRWFLPPNFAPPHSRLERRSGQSHILIRVATPCGPVVVAPRLNRAPR